MAQPTIKALLVSVGGSPEPAIFTINRLRPECLCFFASEETQASINEQIIPKIEQPPQRWDQIITPDAEDLRKCCEALLKDLPGLIRRWEVEPSQMMVDYTGGTKTMSIALALCTIEHSSGYHYIGGGQAIHQANPWDELAVQERREAALIFNRARYAQAADLFQKIELRVSGGGKPFYKALVNLSLGYGLWDAFDHKGAWNKLQEAKKALEMATVFGGPPGIKPLVNVLKENLAFLEKIVLSKQEIIPELFLDLLANAQRRANVEQRYEDAVARLYRALEVLAQVRLAQKGIRSTAVDPMKLPGSLRGEFSQKYTSDIDGKIKIPLQAAFKLLKESGDELGLAFEKQWNNLKALLEARNSSLLAHGFTPIKPERYQQMWEMVLKLSGTSPEKLPQFPRME
jgi:CRISPR-associated protein (TIGR02710 family)